MTLPPLRTGICKIGPLRFPAIIGTPDEIFICGEHITSFVVERTMKGEIRNEWMVRIDAAVKGRLL